ncbi:MAG: dephospho-CoA kinase, partial [Planctomycetes bacterium]|nr:dephospho-CoA kinase [Planctomycetota bacterium]
MKIIGIIGGVASGKSLVARQLKQLGAVVLDGDALGHEVLRR